jgi:hypothetical protein
MLFTFTLRTGGIVGLIFLVLGLVWWFPVGLIILAAFVLSRMIGCWSRPQFAGGFAPGPWQGARGWDGGRGRWESRTADRAERGCGRRQSSSDNRAFDEYRSDTLRRLEDEEREFKEFLQRLRAAKDRAELDQFLNERRNAPRPNASESQA